MILFSLSSSRSTSKTQMHVIDKNLQKNGILYLYQFQFILQLNNRYVYVLKKTIIKNADNTLHRAQKMYLVIKANNVLTTVSSIKNTHKTAESK